MSDVKPESEPVEILDVVFSKDGQQIIPQNTQGKYALSKTRQRHTSRSGTKRVVLNDDEATAKDLVDDSGRISAKTVLIPEPRDDNESRSDTSLDRILRGARGSERAFNRSKSELRAQTMGLYDMEMEAWRAFGYGGPQLSLFQQFRDHAVGPDATSAYMSVATYGSLGRSDRIRVSIIGGEISTTGSDGGPNVPPATTIDGEDAPLRPEPVGGGQFPVLTRRLTVEHILAGLYGNISRVHGRFNSVMVEIMQTLKLIVVIPYDGRTVSTTVKRTLPGIPRKRLQGLLLKTRFPSIHTRLENQTAIVEVVSTQSLPEGEAEASLQDGGQPETTDY
jgi:hypothetical protein